MSDEEIPLVTGILQKRKGDVCRHRHLGTFSGLAGRELCLASDRDRRLRHLITFCPKGRQLKSLILAFVARGESLCCSNPQLPSCHQEMVTGLLGGSSVASAVCLWDKCRLLPPLLAWFPLVTAEGDPTASTPPRGSRSLIGSLACLSCSISITFLSSSLLLSFLQIPRKLNF